MGSVADDLGPDVAPEPDAWPPAPRPADTQAHAPVPAQASVQAPARTTAPAQADDSELAPAYGRPSRGERRMARAALPPRAPVPSTERRYRQTVTKVDMWSVLKMSICFYICSMAVTMVALVALWTIADAAGVVHSVEKFFGDLLQTKDFTFLSKEILRGALLVAAVFVVLAVVITVIAAAFYNMFAELFGGIELTITEDETTL
jgi:Transmembrane domain of unknown function (DUF3566)